MMSAHNTDIEEIVTVKSVHVFHLSFNATEREYELNSVIKDQNLRIFRELIDGRVDSTARDLSQRLAIIKCKDWFYPLEREKTRVFRFRQQRLCYLFPDISNPESVSIVSINTEIVDEIKVLLFENVLLLYCDLQDAPQEWQTIIDQLLTAPSAPVDSEVPMETTESVPEPIGTQTEPPTGQPSGMADTIAKNIVYGAELLNSGITYGTQKANELVKRGAAHLRSGQPSEPTENPEIDPRIISSLHGLRRASSTAASVTGYAVNTVAKGTNQLGKCLAPHIKRQSKKLISNVSGKTDNESDQICDNIFTVASGTLHGFGTLYNGITENVKLLAKTVADETVVLVNHKYGQQSAAATEEALYTAGNTAVTLQNVSHLGPKAIAKRTALDTGKTVISDHKSDKNNDSDITQRQT